MSGTIGYEELRAGTIRQVAQLMGRRRDHRPPNPAGSCSWPGKT